VQHAFVLCILQERAFFQSLSCRRWCGEMFHSLIPFMRPSSSCPIRSCKEFPAGSVCTWLYLVRGGWEKTRPLLRKHRLRLPLHPGQTIRAFTSHPAVKAPPPLDVCRLIVCWELLLLLVPRMTSQALHCSPLPFFYCPPSFSLSAHTNNISNLTVSCQQPKNTYHPLTNRLVTRCAAVRCQIDQKLRQDHPGRHER
jgi:hypothetical protein